MYKILVCCVAVMLGTQVFSQQDDTIFIKRISDEILTNGGAYANLRELTKKIGGRLAGSPQMVMAEKWGARMLTQAKADKVWLQECQVPHWVRGGKDKVTVQGPVPKNLNALALGNSVGTGAAGVTAGVMLVNSFDELEAKKDSVKGKIVFYNYKFNPTFIETFKSYGDAVVYRAAGPDRAAKYGALAVMVRSMTHSMDNNPHTGALHYDSVQPRIPAVAIGLHDADWLSERLSTTKVVAHIQTNAHFLPDTTGHNIIGELKGSQFPDRYITVGGHLDSWDPAEGAHDDGAGVVQTIEVLRTLKALGYVPRHTIRFVLFANEENGTRGGDKYAEEAKAKNEHHVFGLESDAGGFTPRGFGFVGTAEQIKKLSGWLSLLAPYGGGTVYRDEDGTDISPLHTLLNIPTSGLIPDSQRYFDYHHSAADVFENVNKRELELGAVNITALIYLVDKYSGETL